ncbi:MAG: DUF4012 domain-containing protein [Patescibacteria group bacterium]
MPLNRNKTGALFDIKPVDSSGRLAVEKLSNLSPKIDLRTGGSRITKVKREVTVARSFMPVTAVAKSVPPALNRDQALREIEASLASIGDPQSVLVRSGASVVGITLAKPRYHPIVNRSPDIQNERHHNSILNEIRVSSKQATQISQTRISEVPVEPVLVSSNSVVSQTALHRARLGTWLDGFKNQSSRSSPMPIISARPRRGGFINPPRGNLRILMLVSFIAISAAAIAYGLFVKQRIIEQGAHAVSNLQNARDNLANLDFNAATTDFLAAYKNFSKAGEQFHILGANVSALLEALPGTDRLAAARKLVEAGALISDAGSAVTEAVGTLAETRHFFDPATGRSSLSSELMGPTVRALTKAKDNVNKSAELLADVDPALLPADQQEAFKSFKEKIPEFQRLAGTAADGARFLEELIGSRGTKRYLVLFQNFSELRPSGGFPGSYGVAVFEDGRLKELKVDDIYNPDGQLKDLIVPPAPLQHITVNWAMRDAGWFVDFPESARKFIWFFRRESGTSVDGVFTVSPRVITEVLKLVGPVELPAYKKTLTSENFLAEVQSDVEYGDNNKKLNQPKKILTDFVPLFLSKLSNLDGAKWLDAVNIIMASLERKDVLMYFKTPALQDFVLEHELGGQVSQDRSDYLTVNFANIKGAKTDAVTDSALSLTTTIDGGIIRHKATITRTHTGGKSQYGFYNRQNSSYVRVLVPKGSQLLGVKGISKTDYRPLVDYATAAFIQDEELTELEKSGTKDQVTGVTTGEEADKTSFGFWMITEPGATKTVELEYSVPAALAKSDYQMTIQKQPGMEFKHFDFSLTPAEGLTVGETEPALRQSGDSYILTGALEKDLNLRIQFK